MIDPTGLASSGQRGESCRTCGTPLHYAAQDEGRSITLPDRSSIILGPASTLSFEMANDERVARLDGQAELHVAPDWARPFLVEVGEAQVRVTGTRFTLTHRDSCAQLSVQSGTVEIASPAVRPRKLKAGEEAGVIRRSTIAKFLP